MSLPEGRPSQAADTHGPHPRRPVDMQGSLIREGGSTHVIVLTDLNYGGCCIRTPVTLRAGEAVKLSVSRRGSIAAEVRWYADGKLDFCSRVAPKHGGKLNAERSGSPCRER